MQKKEGRGQVSAEDLLQEQRRVSRAVTRAQQLAFARQINRLIRKTGKLEIEKVNALVALIKGAQSDLRARILELPKGKFTRQFGEQLRAELERVMRGFTARATDQLLKAQEEFADLGIEVGEEAIRSQIRRPPFLGVSPELIENAATRSADLIRSLSARQIGRASDIINRGVIAGRSTFEVAQDMSREFGKGQAQMEVIARTELLGIQGQAKFAQGQEMEKTSPGLRKQWVTVRDGRQRKTHDAVHLTSIPMKDTFKVGRAELRFPRDPAGGFAEEVVQCFVTGTLVQGTFQAGTRISYSGPVINLLTARGAKLTVTPNHPILTPGGFLPAKYLRKGHKLLHYSPTGERSAAGVNAEQGPTRIEEAFRTLSELGGKRHKAVGADDFHGDGRSAQGDVDIVSATGVLLPDPGKRPAENECEVVLEGTAMGKAKIPGARPSHEGFNGINSAPARLPSGGELPSDSSATLGLDRRPFQFLRLGPASRINPSLYEPLANRSPRQSMSVRQGLFGGTLNVGPDYGAEAGNPKSIRLRADAALCECSVQPRGTDSDLMRQGPDRGARAPAADQARHAGDVRSGLANRNAEAMDPRPQGLVGNAEFAADLLQRFPTTVFLDDLVHIENVNYVGQVYDLQSPHGWIVANNIFASNCRCDLILDFSQVPEVEFPPLTEEFMPPVEAPLPGLARKVSVSRKRAFKNLR